MAFLVQYNGDGFDDFGLDEATLTEGNPTAIFRSFCPYRAGGRGPISLGAAQKLPNRASFRCWEF
jgi:hypothetical protein